MKKKPKNIELSLTPFHKSVHFLQTWGQLNPGIGIDGQKMELEFKFPTKTFYPQINLPFNFLIQKYFFYDNPTWNINYSE